MRLFIVPLLLTLAISCQSKNNQTVKPSASNHTFLATNLAELQTKAEHGNADAQFNLAACYHEGNGVTQNDTEAVKWCIKAAQQGHVKAQYNLGNFYRKGVGVPQNDVEATKWFREASEHGNAQAQFYLANSYAQGLGIVRDDIEAYAWICISATNGEVKAPKFRNILVRRLSPKDIEKAQERVQKLQTEILARVPKH